MASEDVEQFSQPIFNDSPITPQSLNSSQVHSQTPETQSSSTGDFSQFPSPIMSRNLQCPRTFPDNPINAQISSQIQQQSVPTHPYQGFHDNPINAQISSQIQQQSVPTHPYQGFPSNVIYLAVPPQPQPPQPPQVSKKRKSTTSSPEATPPIIRWWTVEEDIALTHARLYVSSDGDIGVNQKSATLWSRIFQVWKEKMGGSDNGRDSNALECHWGKLQGEINKFHGFYEREERLNKSGKTPENMKSDAQLAYQTMSKGKPFKHLECWEICRKNVKWCTQKLTKQNSHKKPKRVLGISDEQPTPNETQSDPANGSSSPILNVDAALDSAEDKTENDGGITRPEKGRKAIKEQKRRMVAENGVADALGTLNSSLEKQLELTRVELEEKKEREKKDYELCEKIFSAEIELKERSQKIKDAEIELKTRNQKMKEKAQKREQQERILDKDLSKLSSFVRQKYEAMQAQIFAEWEKDGLFGDASDGDD